MLVVAVPRRYLRALYPTSVTSGRRNTSAPTHPRLVISHSCIVWHIRSGQDPASSPLSGKRSQIVFTVDPQPIPPPDIGPIRIHALDRHSLSHVADAREAVACMYEVVARLLRDAVLEVQGPVLPVMFDGRHRCRCRGRLEWRHRRLGEGEKCCIKCGDAETEMHFAVLMVAPDARIPGKSIMGMPAEDWGPLQFDEYLRPRGSTYKISVSNGKPSVALESR